MMIDRVLAFLCRVNGYLCQSRWFDKQSARVSHIVKPELNGNYDGVHVIITIINVHWRSPSSRAQTTIQRNPFSLDCNVINFESNRVGFNFFFFALHCIHFIVCVKNSRARPATNSKTNPFALGCFVCVRWCIWLNVVSFLAYTTFTYDAAKEIEFDAAVDKNEKKKSYDNDNDSSDRNYLKNIKIECRKVKRAVNPWAHYYSS